MPSTKTGIEWCTAVWNPMTGCTQISAGCNHCYALTVANTKTRDIYLAQEPVKDTPANRKTHSHRGSGRTVSTSRYGGASRSGSS